MYERRRPSMLLLQVFFGEFQKQPVLAG